jgi:hypothetical protein
MTPTEATIYTVFLLEHFFGENTDWFVRVISEWPGRPDVGGHCDDDGFCITLVEKYMVDDANARRIICHEVSHALTPDDWNHGPAFSAALALVSEARPGHKHRAPVNGTPA